ncbi:hypothetical protein N7462_003440 [Penicillium macrosclerotiorum]|uniref:uncharacterized protein n=1 Tax=Penicillium macrosclerotiorum TaxID=303699 RepID=UPI0025481F69|nr:uncharacterized protein N7462_003440 [Penicillium macrosclerotiorum]KAJ5689048.1 hypothetical protein N7462_003440 [Penicillium macrosclerotiorum]
MEAAPLALAHTHARNAVLETRKSNPVAASEEHDLAAGEFATAAQSSSDQEALRTLHLLEHHHKRLAEILRFQHEHPSSTVSETPAATAVLKPSTQPATTDAGAAKFPSQDAQNPTPRLPGAPRLPSRESSSIASDLASARGIPAHPRRGSPVSPTLSSHQAGAKMTEGPSRIKSGEARLREVPAKSRNSRAPAGRQPWSPPLPSHTEVTAQQVLPPDSAESTHPKAKPATADEPFQRFYSTFEGLISKISAPLAFAGLPLGTEDPTKATPLPRKSPAETKLDRHHATSDRGASAKEPDVNRLFSRAALRSVQDMSGAAIPGNPAESFYVVPTTGGSMPYAGILSRAEKEARRNSLEDGDDDFVDARETPPSPEVRQSTGNAKARAVRRDAADKLMSLQNSKTLEELQMENQALKQLSDTLSKRLHMWEVNAQSSSMALQQSLRAMHHHNAGSPENLQHVSSATNSPMAHMSVAPAMSDSDPRLKELEEIVRRSEQELERVGRENDKLKNVLGRYRDNWEKLKEGAKTRRAKGRASDGPSAPSTPALGTKNPDFPELSQPDGSSSKVTAPTGSGSEPECNVETADA